MTKLIKIIFPEYTKWELLEVYYFNVAWYVVQVRQNKKTGYKKFKCRKFINPHYGSNAQKLTVEYIESRFTTK